MRWRRCGLLIAVGVLASCGTHTRSSTGDRGDRSLKVAAAFYPIEEVVRSVGGDQVDLVTLVPPGNEAHEFEPTPRQLADLESADVVFYLGGFQPNLETTIKALPESVEKVDLLAGIVMRKIGATLPGTGTDPELITGSNDPHVWLDPANVQVMAADVAQVLATAAPSRASDFTDAAANYSAALAKLDASFTTGLASCTSTVVVTGHQAFGYLTGAYGLTQVAIAGISPAEEPSAQTLEAVARFAADNAVTTIFFEQNLPDGLSRTVADEIGARTAVLNTLETLSSDQLDEGATYISVMEQNLAALRAGLGCR